MLLNKELNHNYEITIFIVILFTIIYSMINNDNKIFIAKILINDFVIFLMIVLLSSLFITYNYIMGILLTIIYIIMILPYFRGYFTKLNNKEGFSDNDLMSIISGKGKKTKDLFKKINKYKSEKKREKVLETINIDDDREEEFNNGNSTDTALKIEKRKFNPNDEVDNNLLITKEICNDIKNRISYNYENIEYLKKYISSRLQEIIDILDLTE